MANITGSHTLAMDEVVIGLCFSIFSLVEIIFYIPCLVVMKTDVELKVHSCFQMMFHLGIADLVNLIVQFLTGICIATGWIYKIPFWLNDLVGGIFVSFSWYTYLPICNVIAFNRFVCICFPARQDILFSAKATKLWMSFCWLYGGLWCVNFVIIPGGDFVYIPEIFTFGTTLTAPRRTIIGWQSWWQNFINLSMAAFWYIAIIVYLNAVRRSMTGLQSEMQKKERRIMAQASLICLYTLAFDQYWHWVAGPLYGDLGFKYAYGLGNLLWITTSGVNSLIYLTLNKTIKEKVKEFISCQNDRVQTIAMNQIREKQQGSNSLENNNIE